MPRPKGSKNKPKNTPPPTKKGRPKGSRNEIWEPMTDGLHRKLLKCKHCGVWDSGEEKCGYCGRGR